ncbi:MAG: PAS domain S-box protein [Candidatus Colwellbacteria bacterium]|nr:PAS domain S-box protein [Candidatus Colwellbacteria bacterium]
MTHVYKEDIEKLQKELSPITKAFDLIPEHIVITDAEGIILYANKGVEKQTGYSREEVIGKNPGHLWGGKMDKLFYEGMWRRIKTDKKPFFGEVKNVRKDGTEYYQELRVYPVLSEDGEIRIFIGIEPNITGRKAAEAELKKKFEEMDKLNKFMTGREVRMAELKKEVQTLKGRLEEIS